MSTRVPTDKRGRARVAKMLDAAAEILVETNNLSAVTTTAVAERSDVSIATLYRYFADRDEIARTLFERETAGLDQLLMQRFIELETVTLGNLMNIMVMCHYEYFKENPRASKIWFGSRGNREAAEQVDRRYAYMGRWFMEGARKADFIVPETPDFGGELIVWTGDTALRFIFSKARPEAEELAILSEWEAMINSRIDTYITPTGRKGLPPLEFLEKAGAFALPGTGEQP